MSNNRIHLFDGYALDLMRVKAKIRLTFSLGIVRIPTVVFDCSSPREISHSSHEVNRQLGSRSKALAIFNRSDEGLNHLGVDVVAVELVQLREPEVVARVV